MNKTVVGIIVALIILVVAGTGYVALKHHSVAVPHPVPTEMKLTPTPKLMIPTVTMSPTKQTVSPTQNTSDFNAMYESAYVTECSALMGQKENTVCTCAANYLLAHYSQSQLMQLSTQFHTTKQIPAPYQSAYEMCLK